MAIEPRRTIEEIPFGDYILLRRLAVGGMAEIFLARSRDAAPDEFIVIKRLLGHFSQNPGLIQMFLDEARIVATLDHPNIVQIYNVGTVGEHFFLSMEYLTGLDLSRLNREMWRQKRTVPIGHVLYIVHRVCKALDYAHNRRSLRGEPLNIVHRDLSPHNVFLTLDGAVKLLDFGVAKAANALHKTKTGALIGRLAYMSPEHYHSSRLDGRSDLFSLGIIMWELSVGRRLYNIKKLGEFEVLRRIAEDPVPDPSHFNPRYPDVVKHILDRVLRKDRNERFPSAAAFAAAIEAAADSLSVDLSQKSMAQFITGDMPEVVERITSSVPQIDHTPQSSPSLLSPSLSPSLRASPSVVISPEHLEDEERTERRIRRQPKVTWNQFRISPQPTPTSKGGLSKEMWWLVILLVLIAGGLVGIIAIVAG